jgi:hypothetical protein
MSGQDWVAIIGATGGALVLVLGAISALYVRIQLYHREINGRMDQLLETTRTSGVAEGRLERPRKFPPDWIE